MKKELLTVSMLAAAFALSATEYTSPNIIGRCDISKASTTTKLIVPVPFLNFDANPASMAEIKVADLIQTGNLSAGDKIYKVDGNQYLCWQLSNDKTTWTPIAPVAIGGGAASGTGDATVATLSRGDGFWLETSATSVVLLGQAPSSDAKIQMNFAANSWNLVGISGTEDVALTSILGAKGDKIELSDGTRLDYGATNGWKNRATDGVTPTSLTAGTGFWYYSKSGGSISL